MSFAELGLEPRLLTAIESKGYTVPSPIQEKAIPAVMAGGDVMAAAQTGTGKTAGFTLPLLHRLASGKPARNREARALVLTPTRELAAQVAESVATYGVDLPLTSAVVFGGVKINPQMMRLQTWLQTFLWQLLAAYWISSAKRHIDLGRVEFFVLDEADRMLDMGFIRDIEKVIKLLPKKRQNLLFSATMPKSIAKLARKFPEQCRHG